MGTKHGICNHRAFTLVEILVVLAIIGAIAVIGVRKLNKSENLKTTVRKLSAVLKKTRAYAKLTSKTYRLVLKKSTKEPHSYWIESTNQIHLIDPKADDKFRLTMDKEKDKLRSNFQNATDILPKPRYIPKDWFFGRIETTGKPEFQDSELTYIYFFPQGVSEEAIIQITNKNKITWTLYLNPLISNPSLYQEAKVLKDFKQ